ncbi:MAG: HAMP domain-containing histidine kinase, partial [Anaeroplasmataceae bacterium]|nr:HAMP domain-containing histidine kinase [Anaeroplasmataceae bacterium]
MKKKRDSRITVKYIRFKIYFSLFMLFIAVSVAFLSIFYTIPRNSFENEVYAVLALITFIAIVCGILIGAVAFIYKREILRPIDRLSVAAKKVAEGDFSIRLEPIRKDGKKDDFEVLFDDFNTMVSELASTEILKQDFISNVSHEFKTPLSVIQNYSVMLQSDGLSESERKEYAIKINEATKRLSILVTDILQLSRIENQKIDVNKHKYNLHEQLCRCIIGYEQIWETKNIEINIDVNQNIEIFSDENLLDIVWNNL